jgi:(1->4)-alpha-D-glucan 1-alpha-D-glucosylmutase
VSQHDRRYIRAAIRCAKERAGDITPLMFDFIERLLLKELKTSSPADCDARTRIIGKFQQITSPVAAKGIEDTVLYVYNRLIALNDVGADPTRFGVDPEAVHTWMAARQRQWPFALSTTSTHDTKRGEDVRARISVLSEIPGAWKVAVTRWRALNRRFKSDVEGRPAPSSNQEYFIYQTLVGAWPLETGEESASLFRQRMRDYMLKALREEKAHSSWLNPDEQYESAVLRFVDAILDRRRGAAFLQSFLPFQARVAALGMYNGLAQTLIKITSPGVPDFYQGTELWDLSLVDPDNRRPVDYGRRRAMLEAVGQSANVDELLAGWHDGRIKLFVIAKALAARAARRSVFQSGEYVPLETAGSRRDCLFAFARRLNGAVAVTCVPRLVATLTPDVATPPLGAVWGDTRVLLPSDTAARPFTDALTGGVVDVDPVDGRPALAAASLFARLPLALLA